jgi:hypothetical protein
MAAALADRFGAYHQQLTPIRAAPTPTLTHLRNGNGNGNSNGSGQRYFGYAGIEQCGGHGGFNNRMAPSFFEQVQLTV